MNALTLGLTTRTTLATIVGEGETEYLTDENGVLILDENNNPIIVSSIVADPSFDFPGDYSNANYAHNIVFLQSFTRFGIAYPSGTVWATMGSATDLVRAEDPNNPRDKPYTTSNQNTGVWNWHNIADRGTKWEFVKE